MVQKPNGAVEPIVYVVDPDADVRRSLCTLLLAHGYRVEPFASGRDLQNAHVSRRPDCVLIELELPDVCGLDLAVTVGKWECPPPVIVMGSQADALAAPRVNECGAIGLLEKPFVSCALLTMLERSIRTSTSAQRAAE
jgi:FixJ family two-component response regulator